MEITIKETGDIKLLTIIDEKTGCDFAADFIGDDPETTYDPRVGYVMTKETFNWWEKIIENEEKINLIIAEAKEELDDEEFDSFSFDLNELGKNDMEHRLKHAIRIAKDYEFDSPTINELESESTGITYPMPNESQNDEIYKAFNKIKRAPKVLDNSIMWKRFLLDHDGPSIYYEYSKGISHFFENCRNPTLILWALTKLDLFTNMDYIKLSVELMDSVAINTIPKKASPDIKNFLNKFNTILENAKKWIEGTEAKSPNINGLAFEVNQIAGYLKSHDLHENLKPLLYIAEIVGLMINPTDYTKINASASIEILKLVLKRKEVLMLDLNNGDSYGQEKAMFPINDHYVSMVNRALHISFN